MSEEVVGKLRELVSPTGQQLDASSSRIVAMALIARLKAIHRAAFATTRLHKDHTSAARQDMDQSNLNLQNLLYEKRHLEREIEKCRQFASIYQDVPLCSIDHFIHHAPAAAQTHHDEHQLMVNRLNFELQERIRLDTMRAALLQENEKLLAESSAKLKTMDNVKTQIDLLVKTASEIQKKVDVLVQPITAPPAATATGLM